jgi:hypothetical protein
VHRLVCLEWFQNVENAIAWETEIKKRRHEKGVELILPENPTWENLAAGWGEARAMKGREAGSSPIFQTGSQ